MSHRTHTQIRTLRAAKRLELIDRFLWLLAFLCVGLSAYIARLMWLPGIHE